MSRRAAVVQRPDQRGPREKRIGKFRKANVIGVKAGHDFAVDSPDRLVVVAQQMRRHLFFPRRAVHLTRAHERDVASDVFAEQLFGLEEIVFVVLFEHAHARGLAERAEMHGRRIDRRGDVHEAQVEGAPRQLESAHVADEGNIGVVDGDIEIDLIVEGRRALRRRGLNGFHSRLAAAGESATPRQSSATRTNRADMNGSFFCREARCPAPRSLAPLAALDWALPHCSLERSRGIFLQQRTQDRPPFEV